MHYKTVYFWIAASHPHNSLVIQAQEQANIISAHTGLLTEILHPAIPDFKSKLAEICRNGDPLFWHYGGLDPYLFPHRHQSNIVFVYHNITPAKYFWTTDPLVAVRSLLGRLQLKTLVRSHRWIAVSPFNASELTALGGRHVTTCPLVIPAAGGASHPKTPHPSLLFVGRISPNKNCLDLLDTAAAIANLVARPVELIVVGSAKPGSRYGKLFETKIQELQNHPWLILRWEQALGVDELQMRYQESWLYLSTSLHEGFGVPACESISHGTPAIYLECGGQESALRGHGMVPLAERRALPERAARLINNPSELKVLLEGQLVQIQQYLPPIIHAEILRVYGNHFGL